MITGRAINKHGFAALCTLGSLLLSAPSASSQQNVADRRVSPDRVYSAFSFNARPLGSDIWLTTSLGAHHWIRVDQIVLRLRTNKTFRASTRYYRSRRDSRTIPASRVLLSDAVDGVYSIHGDTISLYIRPGKKDKRATRVMGRIVRGELRLAHTLVDGTDRHAIAVSFRRDPTIW